MLWRYRWSMLCYKPNRIINILPLFSRYYQFYSVECLTSKTQNIHQENLGEHFPGRSKFTLTHHTVHSILSRCPSNLLALSLFLWCAKQPNFFHDRVTIDHMVGVVTRLLERCKTVKVVVLELEKIGCVAKAQTFLLLLRIFWYGGMHGKVLETFMQMCSYDFTPNTFACNVVMDVYFKIGRADLAMGVLRKTESPNFLTFNIALCNSCNLKNWFLIRETFRMMLRMGYYPNVETFEKVLNCFCKMGKFMEAYQVVGLMIVLGTPASTKVWSILIDGFSRFSRLDVAVNLLNKMVKIGVSPTVVTYTSLIKGCMELHMVSDALSILQIMESKGYTFDLVLCNVLIDCLSKVGRYNDAINIFLGLLNKQIAPDSYTLCSLLSVIRLSRKFSLLPKLVHGLEVKADLKVCNSLLSYLCKAGFPSQAVKLYNDMEHEGLSPDHYTFVGLLNGLCGARRIDEAMDVYHGIMKYACQDPHILTVLVGGLIKVGQFHRAINLFREAVAKGHSLDVVSYTVAIHGLFSGGRTAEACILFQQMKEVGLVPNAYTYRVMLSGFCKERDIKMVKQMLKEIIDARIELDKFSSLKLFNFLLRSHHSHLVSSQIIEILYLGLIPSDTINILFHDVLVKGGKLNNGSSTPLTGSDLFADTSASEDVSDMAASVG